MYLATPARGHVNVRIGSQGAKNMKENHNKGNGATRRRSFLNAVSPRPLVGLSPAAVVSAIIAETFADST